MKNEEINKAIAESLGWKYVRTMISSKRINPFAFGINTNGQSEIVPNYAESLDACAEFENSLKQTTVGQKYVRELMKTSDAADPWNDSADWLRLATAPPLQRCEAYLRMKGLWK